MPPEEARKRHAPRDGLRGIRRQAGGDAPLLPGGCGEEKILREMALPSIGESVAELLRQVIVEVVGVLTPIINVVGLGMVIVGLLLGLGLRQEFLGFRLIIGGALSLLTVNVIIPLLLGFI